MTNQKAIALLEEIRPKKCKMVDGRLQGGYPDHDSDIGKAIDMAIEALEKQIPKKPYGTNGNWVNLSMNRCPYCKTYPLNPKGDYCPNCGQALDWSET